jgi:hypothetical protein
MGLPISSYAVLSFLADNLRRQDDSIERSGTASYEAIYDAIPSDNYSRVRQLSSPRVRSYEIEAARRAVGQFKLFAFVIHDPERHANFHRALARQFDRLDFITGKKLLFFALVDPPAEWVRHARQRLLSTIEEIRYHSRR